MKKKRNGRNALGILMALWMACSLWACGSGGGDDLSANAAKEAETAEAETSEVKEEAAEEGGEENSQDAQSGEELDVVEPDPADDDWYRRGDVYTDDKGRTLEVFFDDGGMLQFAVDGLTLYSAQADEVQLENDWRIYTCDEGPSIVFYPGTPAHLEISDGDYAGIYEAGGGKTE